MPRHIILASPAPQPLTCLRHIDTWYPDSDLMGLVEGARL